MSHRNRSHSETGVLRLHTFGGAQGPPQDAVGRAREPTRGEKGVRKTGNGREPRSGVGTQRRRKDGTPIVSSASEGVETGWCLGAVAFLG
jgi:hypothetical protein